MPRRCLALALLATTLTIRAFGTASPMLPKALNTAPLVVSLNDDTGAAIDPQRLSGVKVCPVVYCDH